jgi:small subunit ribosomal protein S16
MPVKIRLSRIGKKHAPFYRVVALDGREKRDGKFLANIGTYDALKGNIVTFDAVLYDEWVSKGAQPTDSARRLYKLNKKMLKNKDEQKAEPAEKIKRRRSVAKEEPVVQESQDSSHPSTVRDI